MEPFCLIATNFSSSKVQQEAETWILDWVSDHLGVPPLSGRRIQVGDAFVVVDGATEDEAILVEVFAHQGRLKGAQLHKVSTDALKLITVANTRDPRPRLILALADPEAAASVTGSSWRAEALRSSAIEVLVAELTSDQRDAIKTAQVRQRMVNADPT